MDRAQNNSTHTNRKPTHRPPAHLATPGVQAGSGGGSGGASTSGSGDGWSWEGFKEEAARKWDDWQQLPGQWGEQSKQAAQDLGQKFSWQTVEDWQERHWLAFEERQRARLAALTEEQRQRWEELEKEGKELWQKEKGAWEEWQQRWWERNHPEDLKAKKAASKPCKQCTLTYLMLPLLPDFKENIRTFGRRTKVPGLGGRASREAAGSGSGGESNSVAAGGQYWPD